MHAGKQMLRTQCLARRDQLTESYRQQAATRMAALAAPQLEQVLRHPNAKINPVVAAYDPIRSEIDPAALLDHPSIANHTICLPVVTGKIAMEFRLHQPGTPLQSAGFGTKGPPDTAKIVEPDIILMPLAAFDGSGNRIGYGAGYYDHAIASLRSKGKSPFLLGLAFDCQMVDQVPAEPHDIPLHGVATETTFHTMAPTNNHQVQAS